MKQITALAGRPLPLGATIYDHHVRFAVFSRHATRVWLMLFDNPADNEPSYEIELDSDLNRTGEIWHIDVYGAKQGQLYLYRMDGPYQPILGKRFNPYRGLLDPYARALTHTFNSDKQRYVHEYDEGSSVDIPRRSKAKNYGDLPKCIVISDEFNWEGDKPLKRRLRHTIIYEMHVRGLSAHPSAKTNAPGTYEAVIDMIPHFQELGITAIELLPVQACDRSVANRINPFTGVTLSNYWGYNPIALSALERGYSANQGLGEEIQEFKRMVRELHKGGIEVILDVVYNHTAEGNHTGPFLSFKGIDNEIYYLLERDKRYYRNYSGTGNTFNCNHPIVRDSILDSLRYWVVEMHVDGFRFDLASILSRDKNGQLLEDPPIVERIAEDPILRNTKIIAEAWDAAGAYQVGSFPGGRWAEWNGLYRDDIRRYWRGDAGMVSALATRLSGSSDLYLRDGRSPFHSVNFITSHDGFTMNDLVSYKHKHNQANGENNQDGDNHNINDNLGVEGPTDNPIVEQLRIQRVKNFMTTLMVSQGMPMILAGDEFRRTQGGNNNAYAQDNEISWIDWTLKEKHAGVYRFVREVIAFRKRHPIFYRPHFFTGDRVSLDIQWFSHTCNEPDWGPDSHTLMCLIYGHHDLIGEYLSNNDALLLFNNHPDDITFVLPATPQNKVWKLIIDTALPSPQDIRLEADALVLPDKRRYMVKGQSMVVLLSFER